MEIYDLAAIPDRLLPRVGGKARGLCLLARAGIAVPPGFVIFGMQPGEDPAPALARWHEKKLGAVAIRSSAAAEDGAEFSNAGQFATYLNITADRDFAARLNDCLASAQSEQVQRYAAAFSNTAGREMTVVVQQMVAAKAAGVFFTKDPTGRPSALLEVVAGLGEALVSGQRQADDFRFAPDGTLASKEGDLLTAAQAEGIYGNAMKARALFRTELDLEWAVDREGRAFFLQARPITTQDMPTVDEFDARGDFSHTVFTSCNVGEMLPGAVTPLTLSTSVYAIDYGMRKMLTSCGVFESLAALPPYSCIVSFSGHLFIDMTTIYALPKRVTGGDKSAVEMSICGRAIPQAPASDMPAADAKTRRRNSLAYARFLLSSGHAKKRQQRLEKKARFDLDQDAGSLYAEIDRKKHLIDEGMYWHFTTSSFSGALNSGLFIALEKEWGDDNALRAAIAGCLENIKGIESADILKSLRRLAGCVLAVHPAAGDYAPDRLLALLEQSTGAIGKNYRAFLRRHGHRAIKEAEMRSKGWADDRLGLAGYLQAVMKGGAVAAEAPADWKASRDYLLKGQKGFGRLALRLLVGLTRTGVVRREGSKAWAIKIIDDFKKAYRALGVKLAAAGLLPDADCVFFLTHGEIGSLLAGRDRDFKKKALARRRLFAEESLLSFEEVAIGAKPIPKKPLANLTGATELSGIPVSKGLVKGPARVVKSPADAKLLQKGEIMVAGFTDIGWSPYFSLAGGLITEVGSALSHGAVVAREYALPLVVNVANATSLIKTGDLLLLDADVGKVLVTPRN